MGSKRRRVRALAGAISPQMQTAWNSDKATHPHRTPHNPMRSVSGCCCPAFCVRIAHARIACRMPRCETHECTRYICIPVYHRRIRPQSSSSAFERACARATIHNPQRRAAPRFVPQRAETLTLNVFRTCVCAHTCWVDCDVIECVSGSTAQRVRRTAERADDQPFSTRYLGYDV